MEYSLLVNVSGNDLLHILPFKKCNTIQVVGSMCLVISTRGIEQPVEVVREERRGCRVLGKIQPSTEVRNTV